jgi:hypothetical protein
MAGELTIKNGLVVSGSTNISGSVTATTFIGAFSGTITDAVSSSYALTASFAPFYVLTSATSSMLAPYLLSNLTSSFTTTSSFNAFTSSINTATSSFVRNNQTSSFVQNSQTSSMLSPYTPNSQTGSFVRNNQTSSFVTNSQTSSFVQNSQTSSFVQNSQTSSMLSPYLFTSRTSSFATTGSGTFSGSITISSSLGVGTAAPSTVGLIRATNDIVAFYSSDERLKTNLQIISNPLKKLNQINGYEFDWIPKSGIHENEGHDIGVIAQEIEKILPDIVTTRNNGYKAVKYEKIVALLIEAVKDLQIQINELKNGNSNL